VKRIVEMSLAFGSLESDGRHYRAAQEEITMLLAQLVEPEIPD
jgi:hypothetical protein